MMIFTAIGQSIYLLTGPALGRIFSPEEFGLYGLFYTFAITAVGVVFLNYDIAIPAAVDDSEARQLTVGASVIALLLTPLAGLVFGCLILWNVTGFGSLPLWAVWVLMLVLLAQAALQLLQNWYVRRQQTIVIGKSSITLNLVRGLSQIVLGMFAPVWWALAAGEFWGRIANVLHLAWSYSLRAADPASRPRRREVLLALRRYRQFPLVLLPAQVLDSLVMLLQSGGLVYIYGPAGLGMFFLMRRTLDMPVAFAFRSLSDVFYARLAHDARVAPERVRPFFVRSVLMIAGTGFLLVVPFMFAAPWLFAVVFGDQWRLAGVLAAIMAPASVMNLAIAPVARVFALTNRPQLRFCFSIVNMVGTVTALIVAQHNSLNLTSLTMLLSSASVAAYLSYFLSGYVACASLRQSDEAGSTERS